MGHFILVILVSKISSLLLAAWQGPKSRCGEFIECKTTCVESCIRQAHPCSHFFLRILKFLSVQAHILLTGVEALSNSVTLKPALTLPLALHWCKVVPLTCQARYWGYYVHVMQCEMQDNICNVLQCPATQGSTMYCMQLQSNAIKCIAVQCSVLSRDVTLCTHGTPNRSKVTPPKQQGSHWLIDNHQSLLNPLWPLVPLASSSGSWELIHAMHLQCNNARQPDLTSGDVM